MRNATNLIETGEFKFDGQDRYPKDRKDLPRPKDLNEAKQMWRDRVRLEWLTEVLDKKKPGPDKGHAHTPYLRQLRCSRSSTPMTCSRFI